MSFSGHRQYSAKCNGSAEGLFQTQSSIITNNSSSIGGARVQLLKGSD